MTHQDRLIVSDIAFYTIKSRHLFLIRSILLQCDHDYYFLLATKYKDITKMKTMRESIWGLSIRGSWSFLIKITSSSKLCQCLQKFRRKLHSRYSKCLWVCKAVSPWAAEIYNGISGRIKRELNLFPRFPNVAVMATNSLVDIKTLSPKFQDLYAKAKDFVEVSTCSKRLQRCQT